MKVEVKFRHFIPSIKALAFWIVGTSWIVFCSYEISKRGNFFPMALTLSALIIVGIGSIVYASAQDEADKEARGGNERD